MKIDPVKRLPHGSQVFLVGGAVRDALLGLAVADRDYVVVGSNPEAMIRAGFLPVGKDFPVFIHPPTGYEYALARTERKSAKGYAGFQFYAEADVSLEQDLLRRDLTINAMALPTSVDLHDLDAVRQQVIDPFGGQVDLKQGIFRHVSSAFSEDPVRILRVARFAARFFSVFSGRQLKLTVAPETFELMQEMVNSGEIDALVGERVWKEFGRGLSERDPEVMLQILEEAEALARLLPELPRQNYANALAALDRAKKLSALSQRFALLAVYLDPADSAMASLEQRWRLPTDVRDLAVILRRDGTQLAQLHALTDNEVLHLIERCDALRKPQRFEEFLQVASQLDQQSLIAEWRQLAEAVRNVDAGKLAAQVKSMASEPTQANPAALPQLAIKDAVRQARLSEVNRLRVK